MNYELETDEKIIFEGEAASKVYDGKVLITLTSKRLLLEKITGVFKKKYEPADSISLENIVFSGEKPQIETKMNQILVTTTDMDIDIKFKDISDAGFFSARLKRAAIEVREAKLREAKLREAQLKEAQLREKGSAGESKPQGLLGGLQLLPGKLRSLPSILRKNPARSAAIGVAAILLIGSLGALTASENSKQAYDAKPVEQVAEATTSTDTSAFMDASAVAETPVAVETTAPTEEPDATPASTPTATPAPTNTPAPTPTPTPTPVPVEESTFWVKFLDVGQGDAALVECDGRYMLIDGGEREKSSLIYTVLKNEQVEKLDIIVGTHPHEDHVGGLAGALNYCNADLVLSPVTEYDSKTFQNFKRYADSNGNGIQVPSAGDSYSLGSATVTILGVDGTQDPNNSSIILSIRYGDTVFLFTGDAEREAEQAVLDSGCDLAATVLKVGHHGSENSTTYPFLREVMPQYAVISVGEGNPYGHPTEGTCSRLRDADVEVFRTDLNGDILAISDGTKVTMTVTKEASKKDIFAGPYVKQETKTETGTNTGITAGNGTGTETGIDTSTGNETTSPDRTYITNTNTNRFHNPECSDVKKIKYNHKEERTCSRETLIEEGYKPCGHCNP